MALIVQKYGGTSMGSPERIRNVAKRVARLIPFYEYDEANFFAVDGAPDDVVALRRQGFANLAELFRTRFARSAALAGGRCQLDPAGPARRAV